MDLAERARADGNTELHRRALNRARELAFVAARVQLEGVINVVEKRGVIRWLTAGTTARRLGHDSVLVLLLKGGVGSCRRVLVRALLCARGS